MAHADPGLRRGRLFVAALRHDRITAPIVLDQPINGETFRAYVEQALLPTLAPGDVVVLDNLGSHKGKAVRQAIRKAGAHLVFLPPYPTTLILDLRDRMARIETKLDGHHDAHVVIDKAFELIGKRFDNVEAEHTALALAVAEDKGDLAISKAKLATLVTAGSAAVTFAVFIGDRVLSLLHLT